jgi:sulfite exporter TauE/SafE
MFSLCLHTIPSGPGLMASLFTVGALGGFTHCAGMCGPFVMAQIKSPATGEKIMTLQRLRHIALLPYHLGRMTTYVGLAALFNTVFQTAIIASPVKDWLAAVLLLLAAMLFLMTVFPAVGAVFPWLTRIRLPIPMDFITRLSGPMTNNHHYLLGVMLGFIPCGLVMAALFATSAAPNPAIAALAMASFALGTIPALFLVGLGGSSFKTKWPRAGRVLTHGAMIFSSLTLIGLAGKLVF